MSFRINAEANDTKLAPTMTADTAAELGCGLGRVYPLIPPAGIEVLRPPWPNRRNAGVGRVGLLPQVLRRSIPKSPAHLNAGVGIGIRFPGGLLPVSTPVGRTGGCSHWEWRVSNTKRGCEKFSAPKTGNTLFAPSKRAQAFLHSLWPHGGQHPYPRQKRRIKNKQAISR